MKRVITLFSVFFVLGLAGMSTGSDGTVDTSLYKYVPPEVESYEVRDIQPGAYVSAMNEKGSIAMELGGAEYSLEIYENDLLSGLEGDDIDSICCYSGQVSGYGSSNVRLTMNTKLGTMGGYVFVEPGTCYYIEPMVYFYKDASPSSHLVYSTKDVRLELDLSNDTIADETIETRASEEISSDHYASNASLISGASQHSMLLLTSGNTVYHLLRLAIFCDTNYYNAYGSNWQTAMLTTANNMEGVYMSQVGVKFQLQQKSWISESWSNDPTTLLGQFTTWVSGYMSTTSPSDMDDLTGKADKAILFSGKEFSGSDLGKSSQAGRYAVIQQVSDSGQYTATEFAKTIIGCHELGHLFNAIHGDATTIGGDYTIMYGTYQGDSNMCQQFSTANKHRINAKSIELEWRCEYYPGTSTSSDGVRLDWYSLCYHKVHSYNSNNFEIRAYYQITNTNSYTLSFSQGFFGCRDFESGEGAPNLDFGHVSNFNLGAGLTYKLSDKTRSFTYGDTFYVWPTYKLTSGSYGPFRWQQGTLPVIETTLNTYSGPDTYNNVKLTNFIVYGPSDPNVGDSIVVQYKYQYVGTGTADFTPYGIFCACRDPSGNNEDFGNIQIKMDASQSCTFTAYKVVDQSGSWQFWPAFYLGGWGPYQWHYATITV